MNNRAILEFAVTVGERMLANGCGTHRIEGLIKKILGNCQLKNYEIFVTTTGIVVTIDSENDGVITMVKQIPKKKMHTEHISLIEDVNCIRYGRRFQNADVRRSNNRRHILSYNRNVYGYICSSAQFK